MVRLSRHKVRLMEAEGNRPAGYVEMVEKAATKRTATHYWLTRQAMDDLLRLFDPVRLHMRRPAQVVPVSYDPDRSHDSPKRGGCCDPPKITEA